MRAECCMKFDSFDTYTYRTITNDHVGTLAEVKAIINAEIARGLTRTGESAHQIRLGTDSQVKGINTNFVTIIILDHIGKGSRGFYARYKSPRIPSITERLFRESMRTIELAFELNDIFDRFCIVPEIHADVNPDLRYKSSSVFREVVGFIEAQGYDCVTKPNSWCASHVADHLVKM